MIGVKVLKQFWKFEKVNNYTFEKLPFLLFHANTPFKEAWSY